MFGNIFHTPALSLIRFKPPFSITYVFLRPQHLSLHLQIASDRNVPESRFTPGGQQNLGTVEPREYIPLNPNWKNPKSTFP